MTCSRQTIFKRFLSILLGTSIAFLGCAVPIPPSGGPEDSTPAILLGSTPANASVNVDAEKIVFRFNERLDERSVPAALSIFPEFEQPADIRYKGDAVEIRFPAPLRDNTTYIVSLDTRLRDAHGVALQSPISVAFGTGNTLNTGRLTGSVLGALRGSPAGSVDIFLYATNGSRSIDPTVESPDYRTQTSDVGAFSLNNIREQEYFVLGLMDQNQNHLLDISEPYAVGVQAIAVWDSVSAEMPSPLFLVSADTTAPEFRQARAEFSDEISIRFSEPVDVLSTNADFWALSDSTSGASYDVLATFAGADTREIRLRTAPISSGRLILEGYAEVADSSDNLMVPIDITINGSEKMRTAATVFSRFLPDSLSVRTSDQHLLVWPGQQAGLLFETFLDGSAQESIKAIVSVSDTTGSPLEFQSSTLDGIRHAIRPVIGEDEFFGPFTIAVAMPDSVHSESFQRMSSQMLGAISGVVDIQTGAGPVIIEVLKTDHPKYTVASTSTLSSGAFVLDGLPAGSGYFLKAFLDRDMNGIWNPGLIYPFQLPEPIIWNDVNESVRARWETALPDTVFVPARSIPTRSTPNN